MNRKTSTITGIEVKEEMRTINPRTKRLIENVERVLIAEIGPPPYNETPPNTPSDVLSDLVDAFALVVSEATGGKWGLGLMVNPATPLTVMKTQERKDLQ